MQAVLAGIANRARINDVDLSRAEVTKVHSEEPGAGILHAGICAGALGNGCLYRNAISAENYSAEN